MLETKTKTLADSLSNNKKNNFPSPPTRKNTN